MPEMDIWMETEKLSGKKNPEKQTLKILSWEGGASATDVTDQQGRRMKKRDRAEWRRRMNKTNWVRKIELTNVKRKVKTKQKKRKYDESYIALEFTWIGDAEKPSP